MSYHPPPADKDKAAARQPPGWYLDPRWYLHRTGPQVLRWWDGTQWGQQTQPLPGRGQEPQLGYPQQPYGQYPRQPSFAPMPPPRRARRKRRIATVAVILIAIMITAALVESGRSHHSAPLPASLPEDLQLSGMVSGHLTTATAIQGMTSTFPSGQGSGFGPTDATACVQNTGEGWEVDLYGRVGAHEMSLSFDGQDTSGNDMADTYVGTHMLDNNADFGGLVAFYWGSSVDLEYPVVGSATLVANRDGHSGTMNVQLTDVPSGGKKLETITGAWRCA